MNLVYIALEYQDFDLKAMMMLMKQVSIESAAMK
jgi:hypothetical protein